MALPFDVEYIAQVEDNYCQSACLAMLAGSLMADGSPDQRAIRRSLEAMPYGPTHHRSRVAWATLTMPSIEWSSRYVEDIDAVYGLLCEQLSRGIPVVMSTRLTEKGHVVVVTAVGAYDDRYFVEALDPAGVFDFDTRGFQPDGRQPAAYYLDQLRIVTQQYDFADSEDIDTAPIPRPMPIYSAYVVGLDEWVPTEEEIEEALGAEVEPLGDPKQDWEWLGGIRST